MDSKVNFQEPQRNLVSSCSEDLLTAVPVTSSSTSVEISDSENMIIHREVQRIILNEVTHLTQQLIRTLITCVSQEVEEYFNKKVEKFASQVSSAVKSELLAIREEPSRVQDSKELCLKGLPVNLKLFITKQILRVTVFCTWRKFSTQEAMIAERKQTMTAITEAVDSLLESIENNISGEELCFLNIPEVKKQQFLSYITELLLDRVTDGIPAVRTHRQALYADIHQEVYTSLMVIGCWMETVSQDSCSDVLWAVKNSYDLKALMDSKDLQALMDSKDLQSVNLRENDLYVLMDTVDKRLLQLREQGLSHRSPERVTDSPGNPEQPCVTPVLMETLRQGSMTLKKLDCDMEIYRCIARVYHKAKLFCGFPNIQRKFKWLADDVWSHLEHLWPDDINVWSNRFQNLHKIIYEDLLTDLGDLTTILVHLNQKKSTTMCICISTSIFRYMLKKKRSTSDGIFSCVGKALSRLFRKNI